MRRKSILFKTFLFAAALISLVSAATLGALYFIMPVYYEASKRDVMQNRLDLLAREVEQAEDIQAARRLIADFGAANNAQVWSYTSETEISTDLSFPFVTISGNVSFAGAVRIEAHDFVTVNESPAFTIQAITSDEADILAARSVTEALDRTESVLSPVYGASALLVNTEEPLAGVAAISSFISAGGPDSRLLVFASSPINSPLLTSLRASCTLQPISEAKGVILSLLPFVLLASVLVAAAAAFFFSKLLTKPILSISGAAEQMQRLTPGAVSPVCSDDELGALSGNLNALYHTLCAHIETLRTEKERATTLEQSKTFFLRAAGHELKTPIAALNGIVEGMIDDVGVYHDRDKYLCESKTLLRTLAGTVNEILDATRSDGADDGGEEAEVPLAALAGGIGGSLRVLAQAKRLRVHTDVPEKITVRTRERMLRTAMTNILSNAVQYAEEDSVIAVTAAQTDGNVTFTVANRCKPISAAHLPHLFEPFYSVSQSRSRRESGTGLGLYIVKRNLDALGLPFALESTEDGVVFRVTFPQR